MGGLSELWFLAPAAALALGLLALAPLGEQVLRRGVVFIDLAVAQRAIRRLKADHPGEYRLTVLVCDSEGQAICRVEEDECP